jgi:importin subunit alpha-6/7
VLRALRRLLSQSEVPPVDAAIKAGAVPLLVQSLSFGSSDEQVEHTPLIVPYLYQYN